MSNNFQNNIWFYLYLCWFFFNVKYTTFIPLIFHIVFDSVRPSLSCTTSRSFFPGYPSCDFLDWSIPRSSQVNRPAQPFNFRCCNSISTSSSVLHIARIVLCSYFTVFWCLFGANICRRILLSNSAKLSSAVFVIAQVSYAHSAIDHKLLQS